MRLKNVSDRAAFDFIREGNRNILNHLFERNLVNALNLIEPYIDNEKRVHELLATSVVLTWEHFASNPWMASKHKFDFVVDYLNRRQLQQLFPEKKIKSKYSFDELEEVLQSYLHQPDVKSIVINNFKALPDLQKQILQYTHFEGVSDDSITHFIGKEEEYIEARRIKAWITWVGMLVQHANMPLEKGLLLAHTEVFIQFSRGELSKDKMLDFELQLSSDKKYAKAYEQFEGLVENIKALYREELKKYISINTATKLSGNIWGKTWTWVSAAFIVAVGVIIWVTDNMPPPTTNSQPTEQNVEPIDSTLESSEH